MPALRELRRIRLDQLAEYEAKGWRPVVVEDGAVGATPYSHGHGAEVLVERETDLVITGPVYGSARIGAAEMAAAQQRPGDFHPICFCRECVTARCATTDYWRGQGQLMGEHAAAVVGLFWAIRLWRREP